MLQMTSDYLSIYMEMGPDEKDLIIMHHYFIILRPNGTRYKLESTMSIEGKEDFSAMQQTVGLTLGIALEFIVQNKILTDKGQAGLFRPINKELYAFGLEELKEFGIKSTETVVEIKEAKL